MKQQVSQLIRLNTHLFSKPSSGNDHFYRLIRIGIEDFDNAGFSDEFEMDLHQPIMAVVMAGAS